MRLADKKSTFQGVEDRRKKSQPEVAVSSIAQLVTAPKSINLGSALACES